METCTDCQRLTARVFSGRCYQCFSHRQRELMDTEYKQLQRDRDNERLRSRLREEQAQADAMTANRKGE